MHFLDLWIKSYGYLKLQGEVWAGQACAAANEKELTTCAKSGGQEENKIQEKWVQLNRLRRRPAASWRPTVRASSLGCDWAATASHRSRVGYQQLPAGRGSTPQPIELYPIFRNFLFRKKEFLEVQEMG
jgi:hypothetical protein